MNTMAAAQVKALLVIASQLSGYSLPTDGSLPTVQLYTHLEMAVEACDAKSAADALFCPVLGMTSMESGAVRVDAQATTVEGAGKPEHTPSLESVTVHELTHWLQYKHHVFDSRWFCPGRFLMEYEAYLAQTKYQVAYENYPIPAYVEIPETYCPTQPEK